MPVIIDNNNYTNNFGYSGSTYVSNAGDETTLELTVSEKIRITTVNNPFTLDPLLNILTSPSVSWTEEGFRPADLVYIARYDSTGTLINSGFNVVSSVSNTELNLATSIPGLFYDIGANEIMEVIAVTNSSGTPSPRRREDLFIEFNHSSNDQVGNPASVIDGELTRVFFGNLSALAFNATQVGSIVGNQSGQFLTQASIKYEGGNLDAFFQYKITLQFVNSGIYNQDSFALGDCLKVYAKGLWSSKVGEVFDRVPFEFDNQANTGWFNEANNSSIPTGGSVVTPVSELKYSINPNSNVTFTVDLAGTSASDLAIGGAYVSTDDSYYKNRVESQSNITYLLDTTIIASGLTYSSYNGVGTASQNDWKIQINSINTVGTNATVDFDFIPRAGFQSFIDSREEEDRLFYLWVRVGNTNFLVYDKQLIKELPIGGPLTMNNDYGFLDHSQNVTSISGDHVGFTGDTEDDIAYYGTFNLDINKETYNSINLRVEAYNTVSEDTFTLQQTNFGFGGVTYQSSTGKYLLNETANINTSLPTTSEKRTAKVLLTGTETPTTYEVGVYYPFLLNWQYWLPLSGVSTDFAPNENQNWEQYDNTGNWTIRMMVELVDNNLAFIHSNTLIDNPYDNNPDVTSTIELQRQSDGTAVTIIPTGEQLFIESTHILTTGSWDVSRVWGMITIEPKEGSPRSICSTIVPFDNDTTNPLTPISGLLCQISYPSANTIKLKCKFDQSKIDTTNGVKITAKIKQVCNDIVDVPKGTTTEEDKWTTGDETKIIS